MRKPSVGTLGITNRWLLDFQFLFKIDDFSALSLLDLMNDFGTGHKSENQWDRCLLFACLIFSAICLR